MKLIIRTILLLTLTALMVAGMLWSRGKSRDTVCKRIDVEVVNDDSTSFVTRDGIERELNQRGLVPTGKPIWQANCEAIERELAKWEYIEAVQCYKDETLGVVYVRVQQIVPVMRVFDGTASYYVNRNGKRMTATDAFRADVPVVEGRFTSKFPPTRLLPMIEYVEADSLLHSLVTMYSVADSNNIYIVPSICGHVVNMGNADGYKQKFRKLLLFYRKVLPKMGWNTYDTISVKWDHQVVATRRVKKEYTVADYDPNDDEPTPDLETMTVGNGHPVAGNPHAQDSEPAKPAADKPSANAAGKKDKAKEKVTAKEKTEAKDNKASVAKKAKTKDATAKKANADKSKKTKEDKTGKKKNKKNN